MLTAAYNLGVMLRSLFGIGTARALQGVKSGAKSPVLALLGVIASVLALSRKVWEQKTIQPITLSLLRTGILENGLERRFYKKLPYSTGC